MDLKGIFYKKSTRYAGIYFTVIIIFGVIYWLFPDGLKGGLPTFISSLYFSVVTITTLGYGDVTPVSDSMKVIVIVQTVIGIVLIGLFVNALIHEQSESEVKQKHNELLESVNRGLYRILKTSIDFRFYIPLTQEFERDYEALLVEKGIRQDSEIIKEKLKNVGVHSYQNNHQGPWRLHIPFESDIFPLRILALASTVREHFFCLEFYKSHRTVEELLTVEGNRLAPDLAVEIQTEVDGNRGASSINNHTFHYNAQSRGVEVEARDYIIDSEHWFQTGQISSSIDLPGSQVVIRVQKKLSGSDDAAYDRLKRSTMLSWVTIDIRGFPRICLQDFRFTRHVDFNGYPVFIASLPTSIDEVRNLHPRETLEYQSKISGAKDGGLLGWFRLHGGS